MATLSANRVTEIDRAKGFAIFLVVVGHIATDTTPPGNEWFSELVYVIYSFHMPFFMYLSGFVMGRTFKELNSLSEYGRYVSARFWRLAPAFFLFAIIILSGKIIASNYMAVDNLPAGWWQGLLDILLVPGQSSAKSLWFVYVLFEFYVLFPILLILSGGRTLPIVLFGLVVHFLPGTPYLMIDWVFEYFVYFAIGIMIAKNYDSIIETFDRYLGLSLFVFFLSMSILYIDVHYLVARLVIGCLSIPALHALMRSELFKNSNVLLQWGLLSYPIYLMNTIAIGFTKGVLLKFYSWEGLNFLWIAPIIFIAGFYGPIIVKRYIFPYLPPLDRATN